ncbi:MAG: SulP family inorganic anion transporter [Vampirovibrio sp.]|nr:SulP family inorganic anion transporter [Vampirovibrio sp.]
MANASPTGISPATLKNDFLSSIVVFLVALPLCLGIAIASGYPAAAGIISGIIGGLVVATLSGCPLQVSGPAAGLITIIWEAAQTHGIENVGIIILVAGGLQILMGIFSLGQWFRAVSPAVIQGMLAGIGVLIFSSQFHVMVDDTPKGNGLENLLSIPQAIMKGLVPVEGSTHHIAAGIGLLTIVVIIGWSWIPGKLKMIPAPLVAVIAALVVAAILGLPINYVEIPSNLAESVRLVNPSQFSMLAEPSVWITILSVAFIASAETLLTATAVEQMTEKSKTDYNKEVLAQGVGNALAGVLGALPITGVIVRSSANVQAGAETRMSAIFHGIWMLIFVMVIPFVLENIPVASLAAILVYTGYKLVNVHAIRRLATFGKAEVAIYVATVMGIVLTNLLEGVVIGLGLALIKWIYSHSQLDIEPVSKPEENVEYIHFRGSASFVNLPKIASALDAVPIGKTVYIHTQELHVVDQAVIELFESFEKRYKLSEGTVNVEWSQLMANARRQDPLRSSAEKAKEKEENGIK